MQLSEPDLTKRYSYADYYSWTFEDRVELIDGKVFVMERSPGTLHQLLLLNISVNLYEAAPKKIFEVLFAPFDVRLPKSSFRDEDIFTVVQPDICVCENDKIDDRGCIGAPVIVVEILTAGDNRRDLRDKFKVYEDAGVKEYWIVFPISKAFFKFTRVDGHFAAYRALTFGDVVTTGILPGFSLNLDDLFAEGSSLNI